MKVLSYKYIKPINYKVPELRRNGYMTRQYIEMVDEYLDSVQLKGKCAFLYAGGSVALTSEVRNVKDGAFEEPLKSNGILVKETAAYSMYQWIGRLPNKEAIQYASINGNTCASSMYALYEAETLLNQDYDMVVIVAEEMTSLRTQKAFFESGVDIQLSEGLAIAVLGKGEGIDTCKWAYSYGSNPFATTIEGYRAVDSDGCGVVKVHGTGTDNNTRAEEVLEEGRKVINYKQRIGHTQGVSGLLEVLMAVESTESSDILCVSSGMGGFYGSCIVRKNV